MENRSRTDLLSGMFQITTMQNEIEDQNEIRITRKH